MTEPRATAISNDGKSQWDMPPNSGETIPPNKYDKAEVHQGKWIFYSSPYLENGGQSKLINEGSGIVELGFYAQSAREVDHKADGICLFEHYYYRGKMQTYTNSAAQLTGFNSGISAAVIFPSNDWDLFTMENFKGERSTRSAGDYSTPEALGVGNDTIKSVRRA